MGVSGTSRYGEGMGGLGAGCPYEEENMGVGVLRTPRYGGGMGVSGLHVLMRRGVWGGGLRDPQIWDRVGGLGAGCPPGGGECGVGV